MSTAPQLSTLPRGARAAGLALLLVLSMFTSCSPPSLPENQCHFLAITNFDAFVWADDLARGKLVLSSPPLAAPFSWDELVVCWNAVAPSGTGLKVEARALYGERAGPYYTLGLWSEDPAKFPRESVNGQKDTEGEVQTDTLILKQHASAAQLRLTLSYLNGVPPPRLKGLGVSFLDRQARLAAREPGRAAWGRQIPVPESSQLAEAGGSEWCSPTCVSMVLAHWARVLQRPDLEVPVSRAAAAIHDPKWVGTGNWVFNTAYAGSFPGMRAWVARVRGLQDIEDWIAAGVPPVLSVSSDLLHGAKADLGNGHLIVCVGFTATGEVVVNDPYADLTKAQAVRRAYPREVVVRAWSRSRQAAYFIYPEGWRTPF